MDSEVNQSPSEQILEQQKLRLSKFLNSIAGSFKILPVFVPLTYLLGYWIVSAYLSANYVVDNTLLDANYFVVGFLFLLVLSAPIIIAKEFLLGFKNNKQETIILLFKSMYALSFFWVALESTLSLISGESSRIFNYMFLGFIVLFVYEVIWKVFFPNENLWRLYLLIFVVLLLFVFIGINVVYPDRIVLRLTYVVFAFMCFMILGQVMEGIIDAFYLPTILIVLVLSALMYGRFMYGELPRELGGGKPMEIELFVEYPEMFKKQPKIGLQIDSANRILCNLVYKTPNQYFIEVNSEYLIINSAQVVAIKRVKPPPRKETKKKQE